MSTRPARAALVPLALALVLAGCGGSDGDDEPRARDEQASAPSEPAAEQPEEISACGELTDAEVGRLTGLTVTHTEKVLPVGGTTCTFTGDGQPAVTVLATATDDGVDDLVEASQVGDEDEVSTEPVDVPGTTEAVLVTDTSYGLTTVSVVATTGTVAYTVYGSGPTAEDEGRVAVAALTVLLGGTSDAPDVAPAEHPCDALTGDEVGSVLGATVSADRGTLGSGGSGRCSYSAQDTDVSLYALDRTAPLQGVVGLEEKAGSDVEELRVDGLSAAYLVAKPTGSDSVDVYVAAPGGTFVLSVTGPDRERSTSLARRLVVLLA